jgi:molybdopterin-guanine dinucleotide biosynthesis protein B
MMFEIGIIGAKNSGKTTLIEALIKALSERELRIATIKHTPHDHSFDTDGKDSYKHRQAGSTVTMAVGNNELALFSGRFEDDVESLLSALSTQYDLCLIEGDKQSEKPKILLTRGWDQKNQFEPKNVTISYGPQIGVEAETHFELNETDRLIDFVLQLCNTSLEKERGE